MIDLNKIRQYREADPDKFYGILTKRLDEIFFSENFALQFFDLIKKSHIDFSTHFKENPKIPYHKVFSPFKIDEFHFVFQFCFEGKIIPPNDYSGMSFLCPPGAPFLFPVITAFIEFHDGFYTFLINQGITPQENEYNVFPPHFFNRYAYPDKDNDFQLNTDQLTQAIYKFFSINNINKLTSNTKILTQNEYERLKENHSINLPCVWREGVTFCEPFCNNRVYMNKTFLAYNSSNPKRKLRKDQVEPIIAEIKNLDEIICSDFPFQKMDWQQNLKLLENLLDSDEK